MSQDFIDLVMQEQATKGKNKGNGLGLNPAIKLVVSWGGKLAIRSAVSQGTTIEISLPCI